MKTAKDSKKKSSPFLIIVALVATLFHLTTWAHVAKVIPQSEIEESLPPMHFDSFGFMLPGDYHLEFNGITKIPKAIYEPDENPNSQFLVPYLPLYIGSKTTKASIVGALVPREALRMYDHMGAHQIQVRTRSTNPCQRTADTKTITEKISTTLVRENLSGIKVSTDQGQRDLLIYEMPDGNVIAMRSDYPLKENIKKEKTWYDTCTVSGNSVVKSSSFGLSLNFGGLKNMFQAGPLKVGIDNNDESYFEYVDSDEPIWKKIKFNGGKGRGLLNFTINVGRQPIYFSRGYVSEIGLANLLNNIDLLQNGQSTQELAASFSQFTFQMVDWLAKQDSLDPTKYFGKENLPIADYAELFETILPNPAQPKIDVPLNVYTPELREALEDIINRSHAVEKEMEWRKALAPTTNGTLIYGEEKPQELMQKICDHISGSIGLPHYFYPHCRISATYIPGVWVYPGGKNIFISAGTLASLTKIDSLLFVLGNAFAHVITRDGSKNIDHLDPVKFGNNLLQVAGTLSLIAPGVAQGINLGGFLTDLTLSSYPTNEKAGIYNHFKTLVPTLGLMVFTDEQEKSAQKNGFQIALAAGASPEVIYESWRSYENDMERILGVYGLDVNSTNIDHEKPIKTFNNKKDQLHWNDKWSHEDAIVAMMVKNEELFKVTYQVEEFYMIKDGELSPNRPDLGIESEYDALATYFRSHMDTYRNALALEPKLLERKKAIGKRFFTPGYRIIENALLGSK